MQSLVEKGTRIDIENLDETQAFSTGANFSFKNAMPRDKDIIALGIRFEMSVTSGDTSVTKTADNVYNALHRLNLKLDGQPLWSLHDRELKWVHWRVWGKKPDVFETPDATGQATKVAYFRMMLPVMLPKTHNPGGKLTVSGTFGADADLDGGDTFDLVSGTVNIATYKGKLNKAQRALGLYYSRRHSPQSVNGDGEQSIPAGLLRFIIAQTTDRSDSLNTFSLKHGGHYFLNDAYYEELRSYMQWKWGITLHKEGDPDTEESTGLVIIDGQQLPVAGSNTKIYYNTTTSKNLELLYVLRGKSPRA